MIWYSESIETQQILEEDEENRNKSYLPIKLRFLQPSDLAEVKNMCEELFPIVYPHAWYEEICCNQNNKFYSIAAEFREKGIIGILIAEIKSFHKLNKEDKTILSDTGKSPISTAYILSLGCLRKYRRNGVASLLLSTFIQHLKQEQNFMVKAIYLHVLTSNTDAIKFYEKFDFSLHSFLPYYYSIKGKAKDGFCYVRYLAENGGRKPQHPLSLFCEYVQTLLINTFKITWLCSRIRNILNWMNLNWHNKFHYFRE